MYRYDGGAVTLDDIVVMDGGAFEVNAPLAYGGALLFDGGTVTGPSTLSIAGTADYRAGTVAPNLLRVPTGGLLQVNGTWMSAGTTEVVGGTLEVVGSTNALALVDGGLLRVTDGTVTATNLYVGGEGSGAVEQTGGTVTTTGYFAVGTDEMGGTGNTGEYRLQGGVLDSRESYVWIGDYGQGQGTLTHSGGLHQASYIGMGWDANAVGTYALSGTGVLDVSDYTSPRGWSTDGEMWVGDADGTGIFYQTGGTLQGNGSLYVGEGNGDGTYQGHGTVTLSGELWNSGRVIADGGELDLSSFSAVYNGADNPLDGTNGWYATNGGRLTLPPTTIDGVTQCIWGDDSTPIDMVNSMVIDFQDVTSGGDVTIGLLAPDHPDVPADTVGNILGIWDIEADPGLVFGTADLTLRYDPTDLGGVAEADLRLFHFDGVNWIDVTAGIDTTNHWLFATGLTGFSPFAAGTNIHIDAGVPPVPAIPEPATIAVLAMGGVGLLRRRTRRTPGRKGLFVL